MDSSDFDHLLNLVKDKIVKKNTVMRESICPENRLSATLRFLATGRSLEDLKFTTGISAPALSGIIPETCKALYDVLRMEFMKFPTHEKEWLEIAKGFEERWQFPNCGGALDGKHVRITPPAHSGAMYYNYKEFYSVVLLALVNSNYEFVLADVGKNGRMADGGVLEDTKFYQGLKNGKLNLPDVNSNTENMNYVFLGDEAFPLPENILKPFPRRELDYNKRIFNYRVSRARNVVENAFGIISSRFRILHTSINLKAENIRYVVLAICTLHNYLRKRCNGYISSTTTDREDVASSTMHRGDWRNDPTALTDLHRLAHETQVLQLN